MTKQERVKLLKQEINDLKKEVDYNNAMQLSLKIVMNQSYGALCTQYFVLFNNQVAGTITAEGRQLTKTMSKVNEDYWYNQWHLDVELHEKLGIIDKGLKVMKIPETESVSVYGDSITGDSIINTQNHGDITIEELYNISCKENDINITDSKEVVPCSLISLNWTEEHGITNSQIKNVIRHKVSKKKWILKTSNNKEITVTNDHSMVVFRNWDKMVVKPSEILENDKVLTYNDDKCELAKCSIECIGEFEDEYVYDLEMEDESHTFIANDILVHNTDSIFVSFHPAIKSIVGFEQLNMAPLDFIHNCDKYRIADFYKDELEKHANSYGVKNVQDFELEKISDSIINIQKKKYIQHIVWEDGIDYEPLTYLQPKGVELVRSSTPVFAREKIPNVIKYLFSKPDSFNIKELLKLIKDMRKEFELADVDDISMQSSCSKYNEKVLDDTNTLEFVSGAHFAVKAAAHHNFLLKKDKSLMNIYELIKSGDKIKYYYCKSNDNPIFAFKRGDFPIEIAPDVDYDLHFEKSILSPINSVIKPLNMPEINRRLSVVMDIFGSIS